MKRVLLMILDGWGVGKHDHSDVIGSTPTPNITELASNNPRALLYTSGENVGLPDGQMGNSEVGHLNIGAGRFSEDQPGLSGSFHCPKPGDREGV